MRRRNLIHAIGGVLPLIVVVLLSGCSKRLSDDSISQALKAGCFSDPVLRNEPVQIAVTNGEVTLSGEVSSDAARLQAYKLANETPGVKKVIDSMTVKTPEVAQTPAQASEPPAATPREKKAAVSAKPAPKPVEKSAETTPSEPVAVAGSRAVDTTPSAVPAAPTAPPPKQYTIPAGTDIRVQMIDSVDSKTSKVGSTFQASLDSPITVEESVVVPKGANVYLKLVNAKSAGKITGQSELELELDHLQTQGGSIPLRSSTYQQVGESRGKQTATRTAIGTGIGAAIGAIAGGGKGAAIGAAIGAGGGVASQILIHGKELQIPSETKLDFKLAEPFQVTVQPGQFTKTGTRTPVQPSDKPKPKEEF